MIEAEGDPTRDALMARRMPFLEHLAELRLRLRNAALGLVLGVAIAWFFREYLLSFFAAPLKDAFARIPESSRALNYTSPLEPFMVQLKLAVLGGVFFAVPVILHQIWSFIAPGLFPNERRMALPVLVIAVLLFFGGAAFAYYVVLPKSYDILMSYADPSTGAMRELFGKASTPNFAIRPMITLDDYWELTSKLLLIFGGVFELPLLLGVLALLGIVTPGTLWRFNRYAILLAFIAGAVFTPGDMVFGQVAMGGALTVLYNLSILVAVLVGRGRRRGADEAAAQANAG